MAARRGLGWARILLGTAGLLVLFVGGLILWAAYLPLPQTTGTLRLPGLRAAVTVERDAVGIPHLRAESLDDLYLAQGFVTAQDRLWQMEALRRVGRGEIAEIAGPAALSLDLEVRTLGQRAAAEASASHLPEDQQRYLAAYARGVNEYIRSHGDRLPLEFRLLRFSPRPWTVVDSMAIGLHMFRTLTNTWQDETMKEALLERIGPERTAELLVTRTDRDHPPGEELVQGPKSKVQGQVTPLTLDLGLRTLHSTLDFGPWTLDFGFAGSNNWVVSGAHTASGKAMLANDPHLQHSAPGIWYTVHLQAPGMNVAGVSLPGLPAVVIGHNERIAWGMTNVGADVQDLYRENFDAANPGRYLVDGRWQEAQVRREVIHVRGQPDRTLDVTVTRHGPLVVNEPGRKYALSWVALKEGLWRFPFPKLNAAGNWEEFTGALRQYPGPAQNFVYADAGGNIGYYAAGLLPLRAKGDGSLPLAGESTENDWKGFLPFEELPHVYNPPSGILVTANARITPDNYPYPLATRWEDPDRTDRIYNLLHSGRKFTVEDFRRIQVDVYSLHHRKIAKALVEAVKGSGTQDIKLKRAAEALGAWDGVAGTDSYAVTIAHFARQELLEHLLRPALGDRMTVYRWPMSAVFLENVLEQRPARWLPPGFANYDDLLTRCLAQALVNLEQRFHSSDIRRWRWGQVMATSFRHPIGGGIPVLRRFFNLGPFEQPGTSYTVKQTTYTLGPSMRFVVDFGDLEHATLTLTTGESGHPVSGHYRDQFPKWLAGEGVPLSFTASAPGREKLALLP